MTTLLDGKLQRITAENLNYFKEFFGSYFLQCCFVTSVKEKWVLGTKTSNFHNLQFRGQGQFSKNLRDQG